MIAKASQREGEPVVHHDALNTTFTGVVHPISTAEAPVYQYRGIKYASVPARFRQSRLHTTYPSRTDATRLGPICPQPRRKTLEEELLGLSEDCIPKQNLKMSEFECLNLNITCPANLTPESRIPVMLWIHGGNNRGSGSNWIYDGGAFVQNGILSGKPVIIVAFNYRLGLLGFAASPALHDDNRVAGDDGVGNYGLRDQQRAMEWVYRFISGFGGDPFNITLFGEASGAADILCHLHSASNEAHPLFRRVIMQSVSAEMEVPSWHAVGYHLSKIMCGLHVHSVDELRAVEPDKLVALGTHFRANNDGVFFRKGFFGSLTPDDAHHRHSEEHHEHAHQLKNPHHHTHSHARSRSRSRPPQSRQTVLQPVMIGDCGDEALLWSLPASLWTANGVVRRARAICQSLTKANVLLRAYDICSSTPADELPNRVLELINDARFAWPTDRIAASIRHARGGRGVWRYVFDQEGPVRPIPHHAVDLVYLFDNVPVPAVPPVSCEPKLFGEVFDACDSDADSDAGSGSEFGTDSGYADEWTLPVVDDWTYARVRDAVQGRWLAFAHGEAPWAEDKVYVFGPEGEVGERSLSIFRSRRRTQVWRDALEPLGMQLVQKVGAELSNGPPAGVKSWF